MKNVRRLTAVTLVLALIFLLSTSAFAAERVDGNQHQYDELIINRWITGGERSVTANIVFQEPEGTEGNGYTFSGTITLTYTYCPENAMRPSNYVTLSRSVSFNEYDNGYTFSLTSNAIPSDCVMVEATFSYSGTITTPNTTRIYQPYDLTIYLT